MRALLYLLTLTVSCFLQNVNCVNKNVEEFIKNKDAMDLVEKYHNNQINTQKDLLKQLNDIRIELCSKTLTNYLKAIKKAGGGYRKNAFEQFRNDPHAMDLVEQFNNKQITDTELFEALKQIKPKMSIDSMYLYVARLNQEKEADGGTPNFQALASASGNPGSSIPNEASAAGGGSRKNAFEKFKDNPAAMALVERFNNKEITDTALFEALKRIKPKMSIKSMYFYLNRLNQEKEEAGGGTPNFQALASASGNPGSSIPNEASAAGGSSRKNAFEKFKDNPRAMALVERYNNKEITDTALFEALKRIKPKLSIKSMYFYLNRLNEEKNGGGTPNLSNQSPSEMWNFSNPTKDLDESPFIQASQIAQQPSNFTSGNPGSSEKGKSTNFSKGSNPDNWSHYSITGSAPHYGDAMPFQQAPMPGTSSFPASNYPFNQSAPFNSSTNFVASQTGTPSLDWSGGNSHNDEGTLASVVRPKNPSSSKGKSATKTGKKPRN